MAKVVLVVDDDPDVLEIAVMLVENLGYRTVPATNAHDALRMVMVDSFDAVFTDVVMPGMNGFQLAKRIHAIKPALPVICVSGYANVIDDREHADIVLRKPYPTATLAAALAKVIPGKTQA
jgi:CheY-like chemotaxis protein